MEKHRNLLLLLNNKCMLMLKRVAFNQRQPFYFDNFHA